MLSSDDPSEALRERSASIPAGQYVGPLPAEEIDRLLAAGDLPPGDAISEGWRDEGKVKFLPHGRERMRVLVVDDDEDGADSSAALVWLHGHDVQVAYDGESALRLALAYQPDVALLDLGNDELRFVTIPDGDAV